MFENVGTNYFCQCLKGNLFSFPFLWRSRFIPNFTAPPFFLGGGDWKYWSRGDKVESLSPIGGQQTLNILRSKISHGGNFEELIAFQITYLMINFYIGLFQCA